MGWPSPGLVNTERLHACSAELIPLGWSYGWYRPPGKIGIPAMCWDRVWGQLRGTPRVSLRDVVRHEMAHALAYHHPELVRTAAFRLAFEAEHDGEWESCLECHSEDFVTPYATVSPEEDFAETVMVYTRHRGEIRRYRDRLGVFRKLRFVRRLPTCLRRLGIPLA